MPRRSIVQDTSDLECHERLEDLFRFSGIHYVIDLIIFLTQQSSYVHLLLEFCKGVLIPRSTSNIDAWGISSRDLPDLSLNELVELVVKLGLVFEIELVKPCRISGH
jgi:hypothetical protein